MTSLPPKATTTFPEDDLAQLELRIAQRADRLAAGLSDSPERDRHYWDQAEDEELELAIGSVRFD